MNRWSGKFRWRKRADAYDRWLSEKDQDAAEVFAKMDAEKWALRGGTSGKGSLSKMIG